MCDIVETNHHFLDGLDSMACSLPLAPPLISTSPESSPKAHSCISKSLDAESHCSHEELVIDLEDCQDFEVPEENLNPGESSAQEPPTPKNGTPNEEFLHKIQGNESIYLQLDGKEELLPDADLSSFEKGALSGVNYDLPPKIFYCMINKYGKMAQADFAFLILREKRKALSAKEIIDLASQRRWMFTWSKKFENQHAWTLQLECDRPNPQFIRFQDGRFGLSELMPYVKKGSLSNSDIVSSARSLQPLRPVFVWATSSHELYQVAQNASADQKVHTFHRSDQREDCSSASATLNRSPKELKLQKLLEDLEISQAAWESPVSAGLRKRKSVDEESSEHQVPTASTAARRKRKRPNGHNQKTSAPPNDWKKRLGLDIKAENDLEAVSSEESNKLHHNQPLIRASEPKLKQQVAEESHDGSKKIDDNNLLWIAVDLGGKRFRSNYCTMEEFGSSIYQKVLDSAEEELKTRRWNQALEALQFQRSVAHENEEKPNVISLDELASLAEAMEKIRQEENQILQQQCLPPVPAFSIPYVQENGKQVYYDFYAQLREE